MRREESGEEEEERGMASNPSSRAPADRVEEDEEARRRRSISRERDCLARSRALDEDLAVVGVEGAEEVEEGRRSDFVRRMRSGIGGEEDGRGRSERRERRRCKCLQAGKKKERASVRKTSAPSPSRSSAR